VEKVFLTADWRDLVMLNYAVDPKLLLKHVPPGTELDPWNGKVFVSLVGFRFLNTRVFGISVPFHSDFEEVNLRFYVRRRHNNEIRRGVVFIREIVPRRAIATVANVFYNENYVALPMRHRIQSGDDQTRSVEYVWKSQLGESGMTVIVKGKPFLPNHGSEEQFITEHYWGYVAQRDGGCLEYHVAHPPWRVWNANQSRFKGDMKDLYFADLAAALCEPPSSAFLAEGSEVTVHRGRRL
jgi:uncharacterized protein YqjF (DUF2071 family)